MAEGPKGAPMTPPDYRQRIVGLLRIALQWRCTPGTELWGWYGLRLRDEALAADFCLKIDRPDLAEQCFSAAKALIWHVEEELRV